MTDLRTMLQQNIYEAILNPSAVVAPATPQPSDAPEPSDSQAPKCDRCGAAMVKRMAQRGRNEGKAFWGCSRFPRCNATKPIDDATDSDVADAFRPGTLPSQPEPQPEPQPQPNSAPSGAQLYETRYTGFVKSKHNMTTHGALRAFERNAQRGFTWGEAIAIFVRISAGGGSENTYGSRSASERWFDMMIDRNVIRKVLD